MGNVSEIEVSDVEEEIKPLLIEDEIIDAAFAIMRDLLIFTDKRLIRVNKQGVTGKKIAYESIPYRSIHQFSLENAGTFDAESELALHVKGQPQPVRIQLNKKIDTGRVGRILASHIL